MKALLCRPSPLCVTHVNKQPTPSDRKYWYRVRMSGVVVVEGLVGSGGGGGGVLALCLWTRVELNLEERERERCHPSVKRLANKSWQSRGGRGAEKIWRSMSQRVIKQKKGGVSFSFFPFFASFSWPHFSAPGPSVYLEPPYDFSFEL